jgi:tRNA G18 (ribose-2'-O)-methylase SpoU
MEIVVILNNIRSNENVGSIFRTCDAAGVSKIFLCGYTPAPVDRFGRENKGLTKASLGAEKSVGWEKVESLKGAIEKLNNSPLTPLLQQERGTEKTNFKIIGVEQSKNSIDYRELKNSKLLAPNSQLVLVFGNEVDGLSQEDLKLCNLVAEIPMHGRKESLNVAVSVGIVLYGLK